MLGLRLVKLTVNFDDPGTYHFYFGDERGTPGSILTFFPWPGARRGQRGAGQVAVTSFAVPPGALTFWVEQLERHHVTVIGPTTRVAGGVEEAAVAFADPDGLTLELVEDARATEVGSWLGAPGIASEHAIHGFHGVTIWSDAGDRTAAVLTDVLGFGEAPDGSSIQYFVAGEGGPGKRVALQPVDEPAYGVGGAGTVHHIAWRVADDDTQLELRERVIAAGLQPTPVIDRNYFHSVYFREPGGVLFELATDPPGFAIDEAPEHLGERLMLPPQYEVDRERIEAAVPSIRLPGGRTTPAR